MQGGRLTHRGCGWQAGGHAGSPVCCSSRRAAAAAKQGVNDSLTVIVAHSSGKLRLAGATAVTRGWPRPTCGFPQPDFPGVWSGKGISRQLIEPLHNSAHP